MGSRGLPRRVVGGALALALVAVAATTLAPPATAAARSVADGFTLSVVETGLNQPHTIRYAPDGRLFLLEQDGEVSIVRNGGLTSALVIDPAQIIEPGGSAGLLSIAFPPDFATAATQHVYLQYTHEPMPGWDYPHNVVSRFTIAGDVIDPDSEEILVHLDTLIGKDGAFKTMHYGGDMEFGLDGKLYVSTGDLLIGPNAQSLANRYGKILRYHPDGSIPSDNPYYDTLSGPFRAIWSIGLRNPFKLAQDETDGSMYIGDVGSSSWEEVDVLQAGQSAANYGWSATEGYTTDPRFVSPLLAYPHDPALAGPGQPYGCAVMGGDVYRPAVASFPKQYRGDFFFADHCEGWLRSIDPDTGSLGPVLVRGLELPVDMAVAPNGSLMILQRQLNGTFSGTLFRLTYDGVTDAPPSISAEPASATAALGQQTTFEVFASGAEPLTYQWYRNDVAVPGATDASYTTPPATLADDGTGYHVVVSNAFGETQSQVAVLTVLDDEPPVPSIDRPQEGGTFAGGQTIRVRGSAVDAEDGELPRSAFTWSVALHHNTHSHPELGPVTGRRTLEFTVPRDTETDPDIFFRITLSVQDSAGITTEVTRDVVPRLTTLSLRTVPLGRSVVLDGVPVATPLDLSAVVGVNRTLVAPPTTASGAAMVLDSWSTGETTSAIEFAAPARPRTYRAFYRVDGGEVGTGTGLSATYFAAPDFTSPVLSRTDRVPYFTWGSGAPAAGVPRDGFSARWTGTVQSQFSETYTFAVPVRGDDVVRVVVDGVEVVDSANATTSGQVALAAGDPVPITIEFVEGTGKAGLQLTWSSTSTPLTALPGSQLEPTP